MSITMYEAIALYDFEHCKESQGAGDITSLVLHMDICQVGVCTCNATGVKLLGQTPPMAEGSLYDELMGSLAVALAETDRAEVEAQWRTQVEGMNPLVKRYLRSGRAMDSDAFKSSGEQVLKVSELEKQLGEAASGWNTMLEAGSRLLAELKLSEEDVRILMVGHLAKSYFAEYTVRSYFCASPFLPDLRFAEYIQKEDVDRICRLGEEIHLARSVVGHDIALVYQVSGKEGALTEKTKVLASARQPMKELEQAAYLEGLLVEKEEGVTLRADGRTLKAELPYMLAAESVEKVDIALKAVENQLLLSIRRTEMPAKVYDIPLEKFGIGKEQA